MRITLISAIDVGMMVSGVFVRLLAGRKETVCDFAFDDGRRAGGHAEMYSCMQRDRNVKQRE